MRYKTWGISRFTLFVLILFPAIAWVLFRIQSQPELSLNALFLYYRQFIWGWGTVLFVLGLLWVFLFRRGIFFARYLAYSVIAAEFLYELYQSVQARNLFHLMASLIYFALALAVFRWLEAWVDLAAFNPKIFWFEGKPKALPYLEVSFRQAGAADDSTPWLPAKVRRLDDKGFFLTLDRPEAKPSDYQRRKKVEFKLRFRDKEIHGEGVVVARLLQNDAAPQVTGIGLLFLPKGLYHFIQYTALYETMKGEGYAF